MRKRLLLAFMAVCTSVSSFALTQGEFVYTPQGRFKITGDNLNPNNTFQNLEGWTAVGEGKTLADLFKPNANGLAEGFNSVSSMQLVADYTKPEGMIFKFVPTDPSTAYVVSFKMKGAVLDNTRIRIPGDGNKTMSGFDLVKIEGNSDHVFGGPTDSLVINTAEELNENWQTFNYAIQGDGTARSWFITFINMHPTIEIADLQIAPAVQFADLRQRDAMLLKLNTYKNCYAWPADKLADVGYDEAIANLQAIGDESGQAELDELVATAEEIVTEFVKANMDDFLAGNADNYLGLYTGEKNLQKLEYIGDWYGLPEKRIHWSVGLNPDLGHFGGNNKWCYNAPNNPIGIRMRTSLDPGVYVFSIEGKSALREDPTSNSWTINEGWDPAYAVAYIGKLGTVKDEEGNDMIVVTDTIACDVKDLESLNFTKFYVTANIAEVAEGDQFEIGFMAYCKDAFKELLCGSVVDVKDASLWVKDNNKYNKKQRSYEENVRTQITAGRDALTKAGEYLADENYLWGKAALKAVVDEIEPLIAGYEAMDQDAIIATYDESVYVNSTTDENGLLQYQVYQTATKFILDANKAFVAQNDKLNSMQTAIETAEATKVMRLYDSATGKDALQAAIDKAKATQATLKAADYSEENAAAVDAANAELAEAVDLFKTTIPAEAIATIADIDFENAAVLNEETGLYSVTGATGTMEFSNWSVDGTGTQPFEKGYWSNGEQLWAGYIRVGNGTGTVVFDPSESGSMGTNILRVACDFYVQGLSGRYLGFFLKNEVQGEDGLMDANVFGLYHNFYNGTTETNTCGVDISKIWAKSGGSYNNASPADAPEETLTANPLQKSHIEVIMDYGRKSMYCTISSVNGDTASPEVALDAIPTKFVLQSNYNNNDRRPWFDNLKIDRIKAGATEPFVDAIQTIQAAGQSGAIYNLAGQKVVKAQKGIFIQNGKKVIK